MPRRSPRPTPRPPLPLRARLRLERLEDRCLLDAGTQLLVTFTTGRMQTVSLAADADLIGALAAWQARLDVRAAEVNQTLSIARIPTDSRFAEQWAHHNVGQGGGKVDADIDAPQAWDGHTGGTSKPVAVIDTGIDYTHPDLYKNVWLNQQEIPLAVRANLTDSDDDGLITFWDLNTPTNIGPGKITDLNGNGVIDAGDALRPAAQGGWADGQSDDAYIDDLVGWDFLNNDNDPFDDNGHGSHVAGIIGAQGNNAVGVAGVNWKAQLAGLKFLGPSGSGSLDGAVAALRYAVAQGIPISNNSYGGATFSQALYDAVNDAGAAGHIFVAAAGNEGRNNDRNANYPSSFSLPNILAVAATTRTDTIAPFTNYGAISVDLGAPGQQILSTVPGGRYAPNSGTSAATPFVAGAAALIWTQNPGLHYSDVMGAILRNVQPLPTLKGRTTTGGRLDLYKTLQEAEPPSEDTSGARVVAVAANSFYTVSSLRVTFNDGMSPATFTGDDVELTNPDGDSIPVTSVRVVPGSGNTQFDLYFATQTTPGEYAILLGPDIRDASGNWMNQNGNEVNGEADDNYFGTFQVQPRPPGPPMPRPGPKIVGVVPNGTTSVSGLRVTFNRVMDPSTFTPGSLTIMSPQFPHLLVVTGVRVVPNTGDTQFDVIFATQSTPSNYTYRIGPSICDDAGNRMDQNNNGLNGEPGDIYTGTFAISTTARVDFSTAVPRPIQGYKTTASQIYVGQSLTIADLNVNVNIRHPYDGKLVIYLRAPNGKITTLSLYRGGTGQNFTNTTFDDEGNLGIAQGAAPFTGAFRPEAPLSAYDGMNAMGYWTLFIYGGTVATAGRLDSWSLSIVAGAFGGKLSLDAETTLTPRVQAESLSSSLPVASLAMPELGTLAAWLVAERQQPVAEKQTPPRDESREVRQHINETAVPVAAEDANRPRSAKKKQLGAIEAF